ncbi:hypothetical protein KL930_004244 [Ogataea haglerorum]|nr:hypothetical protein KL915_004353 [Ogataea haglerorum]KAG7738273.1 hypothetical protein KL932_003880 [Ogataea haglerorum]KAG7773731.1 hypothetical protein KL930_004244 [Ogataea haglerorum]KAG7776481.1 hypothetical protein KL922_003557 [Ogataea haglerorum]
MQLLVVVVALGAGFAIGRTSTRQNPPRDLFPAGSTTTKADLRASSFNAPADYALFQRCVKKLQKELNLSSDDVDEELWRVMAEKPGLGSVLWSHKDTDTAKQYRIRPRDTEQFALLMKLAQLYRVPVHVGVPFDGYPRDRYGLTVDLGGMDRILAYNERTNTVTCECNADVGSFANSRGLSAMNAARPLDLALSWLVRDGLRDGARAGAAHGRVCGAVPDAERGPAGRVGRPRGVAAHVRGQLWVCALRVADGRERGRVQNGQKTGGQAGENGPAARRSSRSGACLRTASADAQRSQPRDKQLREARGERGLCAGPADRAGRCRRAAERRAGVGRSAAAEAGDRPQQSAQPI